MNFNKYKGLPYITTGSAGKLAKKKIREEASGKQLGLYCRWKGINNAVNRYFRFGKIVMIAGMSGSGKSYFLNMLRNDFINQKDTDFGKRSDIIDLGNEDTAINLVYDNEKKLFLLPKMTTNISMHAKFYKESQLILGENGHIYSRGINDNCEYNVVSIHFGYEMSPEDELIRTASTILGKSYGWLISSQKDENGKNHFLSEKAVADISDIIDALGSRPEYYIATSGNTRQMYETIKKIKETNPSAKLLISLDHTLLTAKFKEKSDLELQRSVADFAISCKQDFDALVILLNQMNTEIEKTERIIQPALHYPSKKDIYMGSQIWWACDTVMVNHRPSILNIRRYGNEELITDNLIHCAILKNRQGIIGDIFLKEDFEKGRIHYARKEDFKLKKV